MSLVGGSAIDADDAGAGFATDGIGRQTLAVGDVVDVDSSFSMIPEASIRSLSMVMLPI